MHWCPCKSLLNTLGRAVEQLAGCFAKPSKSQQLRSKYNSMQCQREGLMYYCNCNCNCNLDTPTRGAKEDIQYIHKIILEERGRE